MDIPQPQRHTHMNIFNLILFGAIGIIAVFALFKIEKLLSKIPNNIKDGNINTIKITCVDHLFIIQTQVKIGVILCLIGESVSLFYIFIG